MNHSNTSIPEFDIPVTVTDEFTGNVTPLLHEIRHALAALLETGEQTIIDLRSMPLAPGEEAHIETALGQGEVRVELNALGRSEIIETQYPGVWLITHSNTDGALLGKYIEIALIPDILQAQQGDIQAGLEQLSDTLTTSTEKTNEAI
ncbi:MAG: hydrogenase expression/formation protein [Proteobacteria bacterium]|nr:hydrogenase expression/formation protein [Pseudomonadota bacterium]